MQRLVPHEILLCGVDEGSRHGFEQYHFESTRYFRHCHFETLCNPTSGLLSHLQRISERTKSRVVLCPCDNPFPFDLEEPLRVLIAENELRNLAACLWLGPREKVQAYYSFSRIQPFSESTSYFLELLLPYIHMTFLRVLSNPDDVGNPGVRAGRLVTHRQEEILVLIRDGKTNAEIAQILAVSPWTIKNHIQMIFQRLNTNNRTQTITRAIKLGILRADQ